MAFIIGLLTLCMVLDCLFLVLLVLMQLPKKEAGIGLAFGGAATDALFGAGSGNFLTKATKYSAVAFFGLALFLSVLQIHFFRGSTSEVQRLMKEQQQQPVTLPGPATTPETAPPSTTPSAPAVSPNTNLLILPPPVQAEATDAAPVAPQK